ncbi:PIN domain-containing protein [Marinilabilia rubra]|uniref:DUF4935 domain-containing protein n=1 Tax=Marinilabilia rubra TaxID=2162893 RepID=A0A2U2B341_9BACT|nr:PIN domain-containing protein [Marinilabilia rubra]PWD97470.1 hypothetical protein DDZ16_20610 [Marinilabilia rubra]
MTSIVLDTNIWIYLTKDNYQSLWAKFKELKNNNEIKVLVNDIIIKEWERNKENTIKRLTESIKNEYIAAKNLATYFQGEKKTEYLANIAEYSEESRRIEKARNRVQEIEDFMNNCELIRVTNEQKLFISELAINKKAPFQNNKNNFNDALIIRNILEYVKNEIPFQYDLIFASRNPADFIDKGTGEVYETLLENLNSIRLKNVTELAEALELAPELIDDFEDWIDYQLDMEVQRQLDI